MKRFLTVFMTLLGFGGAMSSCRVEYGSPHADFELKGVVTDAEHHPIKGIRVSVPHEKYGYVIGDDVFTDENGRYLARGGYHIPSNFIVEFDDIDGPENGGEFESTAAPLVVVSSDYKGGDGHWYQGKVTKTVDIELKLKEQ